MKALVLPIFRHYWLWNAWSDQAAPSAAARVVRTWRDGKTLEERFSFLGEQISQRVRDEILSDGGSAASGPLS